MSVVRTFVSRLAAILALSVFAAAAIQSTSGGAPDLEEAARRWQSMGDERRAEMTSRFEQFRALDEDQREALRERAQRLRVERDRLQEGLSSVERTKLDHLGPFERDDVMRHHHEAVARARGERMRGLLPLRLVKELKGAHPAKRPGLLRHWRDGLHERRLIPALRRAGRDLGLKRAEVEAALDAPPEMQARHLREWSKRSEHMGPPWMFDGRPPHSGPGGVPVVADPELERQLSELAAPTLEDSLAIESLRGHGRMRALGERVHKRVLDFAESSDRFSAEELETLRTIDTRELLDRLRKPHFGRKPDPGGSPRRRPR